MVGTVFSKFVSADFLKVPTKIQGKLPAHGDFISRGLNRRHREKIDNWLSDIFTRSQEQWGAAFVSKFRSAQPWLFDGRNLSAIIIPSADKVGRLFPLLVTCRKGILLQKLYDEVRDGIASSLSCDDLSARISGLEPTEYSETSGKWFIPDEDELALAHPLKGKAGVFEVLRS